MSLQPTKMLKYDYEQLSSAQSIGAFDVMAALVLDPAAGNLCDYKLVSEHAFFGRNED